MPQIFDNCVKQGGQVRTISLGGGKYMHVCYEKSGKSYPGEVKTSKTSNTKKTMAKAKKPAGKKPAVKKPAKKGKK